MAGEEARNEVAELLGLGDEPVKIGPRNKNLKKVNADRKRFGGKAVLVHLKKPLDERLDGLRLLLTDEGPYYAPEIQPSGEYDISAAYLAVDSPEDEIEQRGLIAGGRVLLNIIAAELDAVEAVQVCARVNGPEDTAFRDIHPHVPLSVLNPVRFDPNHEAVTVGQVLPFIKPMNDKPL